MRELMEKSDRHRTMESSLQAVRPAKASNPEYEFYLCLLLVLTEQPRRIAQDAQIRQRLRGGSQDREQDAQGSQ